MRERRINCFAGVAFKPVVYVDEGLFLACGFFVGGDEFASGGAGFLVLGNVEPKPRMSGLVHLAVGPLTAEAEDIEFLPIVSYEPVVMRWFVIRAKSRMGYCRLLSHPVDRTIGFRSDQIISLTGFYAAKNYPDKLRLVRFYDTEQLRSLVFLIDHSSLTALLGGSTLPATLASGCRDLIRSTPEKLAISVLTPRIL